MSMRMEVVALRLAGHVVGVVARQCVTLGNPIWQWHLKSGHEPDSRRCGTGVRERIALFTLRECDRPPLRRTFHNCRRT